MLPHPHPTQLLLTCPKPTCGASKKCAKLLLHYKIALKPVKCPFCRSSPSSATWCCPCGHLWHHCPLHRAPGFAAGLGKRSSCAGMRSANLQAVWDYPMIFGPAAVILAMQAPCDSCSINGPPPQQRKVHKTSYPFRRTSGNKSARRKHALVPQIDATLDYSSLFCNLNAVFAPNNFSTDNVSNFLIRPGWVPGAPPRGAAWQPPA